MDESARAALQQGLSRLADGDRSAFEPVFAALWPILRRFASRALPVAAEAEDAAQSSLIKIFARAAEFDARRDALSWAVGIAAYECRTLRKSRSRRREEEMSGVPEAIDWRTPEHAAVDQDLIAAATDVLGGMRVQDVETLLAMARGERDPSAKFRKRLERAIARFRNGWRARHGND
ncbi:MAG TPA: sigma factor [Myxococcales bacterium]|nr:sigma factor [Myxococcales bacterium]